MQSKWFQILSQKKGKIVNTIIILVLIITGLSLGALAGFYSHLEYRKYKEGQAFKRAIEGYLKLYRADVIGGNTPEETIDMFIEALKKGDYELATKYFVVEKQEKARDEIESRKNRVDQIIQEVEYAQKNWNKEIYAEDSIQFWYNKEGAEISRDIGLSRNYNNKWKIDSINIYYLGF